MLRKWFIYKYATTATITTLLPNHFYIYICILSSSKSNLTSVYVSLSKYYYYYFSCVYECFESVCSSVSVSVLVVVVNVVVFYALSLLLLLLSFARDAFKCATQIMNAWTCCVYAEYEFLFTYYIVNVYVNVWYSVQKQQSTNGAQSKAKQSKVHIESHTDRPIDRQTDTQL